MKFRQYYKKILDIFYNNLGFYVGCLMWAAYIRTQDEQKILNNSNLGQKYVEEENVGETDFMIQFVKLFPKDVKYFLGESFEFPKGISEILDMYREFLIINEGFVNAKNNTDVKLPKKQKTKDAEKFKKKIDEVIKSGDLSKLFEYKDLII